MDMMQLVSLLMIPKLREEQEHRKAGHDDLLGYTLEMMLHDVTGSREPKRLNRTLVKQIFQAYGETELAENDVLVEEMLQQAGALDPETRVMLDPDTFCRALTRDVQGYCVETRDKLSTNYQDAFMVDNSTTATGIARVDVVNEANKAKTDVPMVHTAPSLDNAADTFRSRPLVVFQWTFFVMSYQTYLFKYSQKFQELFDGCGELGTDDDDRGAFPCVLGLDVTKWLCFFAVMSVGGLVVIGTTGIGNFVECANPLYPLAAMLFSACFTLLPPWYNYILNEDNRDTPRDYLALTALFLGGCVILLNFWHFVSLSIPKMCQLWSWLQNAFVPEALRSESRNKQAAAHKIDTMVKNALKVHREKKQETVVPTHFGQALLNFAEQPLKYKHTGGFFWTWRMIFSKNLVCRYGISFSGRLLSLNMTQFISTVFVLIGGIMITDVASYGYVAGYVAQAIVEHLDWPPESPDVTVLFPENNYT
jgi:hypothetical protein